MGKVATPIGRVTQRPRHWRIIVVAVLLAAAVFGDASQVNAVVKVLSNSRHAYGTIRSTINDLLGPGHLDEDIIVHSTNMDTTFTSSPSVALDESKTFYDGSGNPVPSAAPYQLYTSSFTGYSGDSVDTYNQFVDYDLAHNYAFTVSTDSPPPAFHIAPGMGSRSSYQGIEWVLDPNIFASSSLSAMTAANAGMMAVLRHDHPTWNWYDVKAALRQTGTNWDTGYDAASHGFGQVNYASSTALTDSEILLQPPPATATFNNVGQLTFTLYPFRQSRRVKEVLFQFDSNPGFRAGELTLSDIAALGGVKITEYTANTATSTLTPIFDAFSNKYFVWFTADNTDDNLANFSRIDTYSVLGPFSQDKITFSNEFDTVSPVNNAPADTSPVFSWQEARSKWGIAKYELYVDDQLYADNLTGTSTSLSVPLTEGEHTWYVRAVNGDGDATTTSPVRTFYAISDYAPGYTFYVDNVFGDDDNLGKSDAPWRTISRADTIARAGDTVVIRRNDDIPYRTSINTSGKGIVFRGESAGSKPEIWGTQNFSQGVAGGWTLYGGGNPNTYEKSAALPVRVFFAGASTSTLTARTQGTSPDALGEGQWAYVSGKLYYRLASGEDINTVHIEAGQHEYGIYCQQKDTFRDIIIKFANNVGVALSAGCTGERLEVYDSYKGALLSGSGTSENDLGPVLRSSILAGNLLEGIILQFARYARVYNNLAYGNKTGLSVQVLVVDTIVRNNIFSNNTSYNIQVTGAGTISNFFASHNNWAFGSIDDDWTNTYQGVSNKASTTPLLADALTRNFRLQPLSQNIDSATSSVSLSSDVAGNPIYGTPDIGPYEYQPPYTIGMDDINTSGSVRLYADGKYRYTSATSSAVVADFKVTPLGGWGNGDYSEYMNVSISKWNTSGGYSKTWTETSSVATTTVHTIGDLKSNTYYVISVDGAQYVAAKTDEGGELTFNYSGGYSSHTFDVSEDTSAPQGLSLSSPEDGKTVSDTTPLFSWNNASDPSGIAKYQVVIDGSVAIDGISSTANTAVAQTPLSCGAHRWQVRAYDNAGNVATSEQRDIVIACGGGIFSGTVTAPRIQEPKPQIIYPDGTIVYFDEGRQDGDEVVLEGGDKGKRERNDANPAKEEINVKNEAEVIITPVLPIDVAVVVRPIRVHLQYGDSGEEVKVLQQILKDAGYFTYPEITGYFGRITRQAVKAFQKANGIEQVGVVGPKTRAALNNLLRKGVDRESGSGSRDFVFAKYLTVGSRGEEVAMLQRALRDLGYFTYPEITGYFGRITRQAVKAFQKANGIEQVGVVGPKTRAALNKALRQIIFGVSG